MAANFKAGNITSPTSTGNAAFTGVGFQPKALILIFNKQTTSGNGVDFLRGTGFAVSASSRRAISAVFLDGVSGGTVNMARAQSNAHILYAFNTTSGSATAFLVADLVSFDSDGFTLNFSTVQASGYLVYYMAFGGTDLENAGRISVAAPAGTGSQAYTTLGFRPTFLFTMTNSDTSAGPGSSHNSGARVGLGFGTSLASKANHSVGDDNSGKKHAKGQKTDITLGIDATTPSVLYEATLTSLDADGFTWNWTTTSSGRRVEVLCLRGGQFNVGVLNQNTSNGNQSVTGLGFTPSGVILSSVNAAASSSMASGGRHSMGAASSSSSRWSVWQGNSADATQVDHDDDTSNVHKVLAEGTPTTTTVADFVSNDSGGFTINNTTTDGTSREIMYVAWGNTLIFNQSKFINQAVNNAGSF